MFEAEATWLSRLLGEHDAASLSPLLNIGSSTSDFREIEQPWTDRILFAPLRDRGIKLVHLDAKDGKGIDIKARVCLIQNCDLWSKQLHLQNFVALLLSA